MKPSKKSVLTITTILISCTAWAAESARLYTTGNFAVELDGQPAGWVRSVEGGGGSAVIAEILSNSGINKYIATPQYDDFTIDVPLGPSGLLRDWIKASWNGNALAKDGAIILADYQGRAKQRAEFYEALISEIGFPACDGASKDPAYLTVKVTPYISTFKKAGNEIVKEPAPTKQKLWLPSNFRLNIDGLECKRVTKINSFSIKQTLVTDDIGDARDYAKEPAKIEYPNLTLLIAQTDIDSWHKWYEDFLVKGNNANENEKTGTLTLLGPNMHDEIAHIDLKGIGLKRFTPFLRSAANSDAIARFEVELYVETMTLVFPK
jgi:hypothetical protein